MVYVLSDRSMTAKSSAETAADALRAFVELRRFNVVATVHDGQGRHVALTNLLATAFWDAREQGTWHQLAATLADYVDDNLRWRSPFHRPSSGDWRAAGETWARDFEQPVPALLLDELDRRHAGAAWGTELAQGAEERLPRCFALPTADRGLWAIWDRQSGEFVDLHAVQGGPRSSAEAPVAGRWWTTADFRGALDAALRLVRRSARDEQARRSRPSPPPPAANWRPGSGRRP